MGNIRGPTQHSGIQGLQQQEVATTSGLKGRVGESRSHGRQPQTGAVPAMAKVGQVQGAQVPTYLHSVPSLRVTPIGPPGSQGASETLPGASEPRSGHGAVPRARSDGEGAARCLRGSGTGQGQNSGKVIGRV